MRLLGVDNCAVCANLCYQPGIVAHSANSAHLRICKLPVFNGLYVATPAASTILRPHCEGYGSASQIKSIDN